MPEPLGVAIRCRHSFNGGSFWGSSTSASDGAVARNFGLRYLRAGEGKMACSDSQVSDRRTSTMIRLSPYLLCLLGVWVGRAVGWNTGAAAEREPSTPRAAVRQSAGEDVWGLSTLGKKAGIDRPGVNEASEDAMNLRRKAARMLANTIGEAAERGLFSMPCAFMRAWSRVFRSSAR